MTVLSAQTIRWRCGLAHHSCGLPDNLMVISPFSEAAQYRGLSYGLSACGYDIRLGNLGKKDVVQSMRTGQPLEETEAQSWLLRPGDFLLCASLEEFHIPPDLVAVVHDKSTWARRGLALQNTVLEPGWRGWITLEVSNHGPESIRLFRGQPIGQVLFHLLDAPTDAPYKGKYQDAPPEPQRAILEGYGSDGAISEDGLL